VFAGTPLAGSHPKANVKFAMLTFETALSISISCASKPRFF
jgi:hypothetical protein